MGQEVIVKITEPVKKVSGYSYSPKTTIGFMKMRQRGIVLPPFRVLDNVARNVNAYYHLLFAQIEKAIFNISLQEGIAVSDSVSPQEQIRIIRDALRGIDPVKKGSKQLRIKLARQLAEAQKHFFKDFSEEAPGRLAMTVNFKLDRDQTFQQHISRIDELYLDSAMERIQGEQNQLKRTFLSYYTSWIKGENLDFTGMKDIMEVMRTTSVKESKFFARDQFARFNKSLTIASYETGGIEYVRWLTVGDGRVRPSHKALQGKIFPVDAIPDEQHDYLCRCALVPATKEAYERQAA